MTHLKLIAAATFSFLWLDVPGLAQQIDDAEIGRVRNHLINDVDRAAVAIHPATAYTESSTVALVKIDLSKFDANAISDWLNESRGSTEPNPQVTMLGGFIQSLIGAGVQDVWLTAGMRSPLDGGAVAILPCENEPVVNGLLTVLVQNLPPTPAQKIHVGDKVVVAGAASAVDRVVANDGIERPDLVLPIKRDDLLDHSLVLSLPEVIRRELVAFWPRQMPQDFPIQASPRQLVSDVTRVVATLRLPPEPALQIHIEAGNAQAAKRVRETVEQALQLGGDLGSSVRLSVNIATVRIDASPSAVAKVVAKLAAPSRARATSMAKMDAMKQIGLAIHSYHATENHLPPRCYVDDNGRPLHSARVALLPHIEQKAMYGSLKLDQPWDSEANRMITSTQIPVYGQHPEHPSRTTIRFPVYPGSLWHGEGPPKMFRDVSDGTSFTIAAIDAPIADATQWANPDPWVLSVDDPVSDVFGGRDAVTVLLLDGSALVLHKDATTNDKLKAMLTIAGKEAVE